MLAAFPIAVLAFSTFFACERAGTPLAPKLHGLVDDAAPVRGHLRLSAFGERGAVKPPTVHTSVFVNGAEYSGMEDNDLRGFLDGVFEYGWNQMGQSHVRVGRRNQSARFGEYEIFRNLHRWDGIDLPPDALVQDATLTLEIEEPAPFPVRLMLYEVKQDWNPGQGGELKNNVSPPVDGEVWWNDRAYGRAAWGLPGVGYASDADPAADTGAQPLAEALVKPGDAKLEFHSERLARYVSARVAAQLPLLFLVKLSDHQEDVPGSMLTLFSGNHGDSRNVARRPSLELVWQSAGELASADHDLFVEYGRTLELPRLETPGAQRFASSFVPDGAARAPSLEVRGGRGDETSAWIPMPPVLNERWDWIQLRTQAATNPLVLGTAFEADLHNTWIRTAAPQEQRVEWRFLSPTGVEHELVAEYLGSYRWRVRFVPEEIGPWRYRWAEDFTESRFDSAEGHFDVVAGDADNIQRQLAALRDALPGMDLDDDAERLRAMLRFAKLERAAMQLQTPASWKLASGEELRHLMREVRERLGGPMPEELRLVADAPPSWAR